MIGFIKIFTGGGPSGRAGRNEEIFAFGYSKESVSDVCNQIEMFIVTRGMQTCIFHVNEAYVGEDRFTI